MRVPSFAAPCVVFEAKAAAIYTESLYARQMSVSQLLLLAFCSPVRGVLPAEKGGSAAELALRRVIMRDGVLEKL